MAISADRRGRLRVFALAVLAALALTACSDGGLVERTTRLWSEPEAPPLPGERIPILQYQNELEPDPALADYRVSLPAVSSNSIWPQAGGYPSHAMGHLALPAPEENTTRRLIWRANIGAGSGRNHRLTAQPIILPKRVITLDSRSQLSAYDRETGGRLWSRSIRPEGERGDVLGGGMALGSGRIFVTTGYGSVLALNPETGETLWEQAISAPSRAAPSVAGGRVFVLTVNNQLLALDAETGTRLWSHQGLSEIAALLGAPSPSTDGQLVVVGYSSGEIVALRPENGAVAWADSLATLRRFGGSGQMADIRAMTVIDRGLVLGISHSGRMLAIEQRSGLRVWELDLSGTETPWVAGEVIYVLGNMQQIFALHRPTGGIIWIADLPRYQNPERQDKPILWSGPVLAGGRLIVTGSHGEVLELNAVNGDIAQSWRTPSAVRIPPAVAGGTLFMLTESGELLAYR